MGFTLEELLGGGLGGEGEARQGVHYEVYPEHLDGFHYLLLDDGGADEGDEHGDDVDGQLELDELFD